MPVSIGPRIGVQGADEFRQAFRLMAQEAKRFSTELDQVKASFTANDTAMDRSKAVTEQLTKQIDQNTRVMQSAVDTREKAKEAVDRAADAYENEKAKLKDIPKLVEENAKKVADATEKYNKQNEVTGKSKENYDKLNKAYKNADKAVTDQSAKIKVLSEEYEKQKGQIKDLSDQYGKNSTEVKNARKAHTELAERLKQERKDLADLKTERSNAKRNLGEATKELTENTSKLNENEKELQKAIKANKSENVLLEEQETKIRNASTRLYEAQNVLSQYEEKVSEVTIEEKKLNDELAKQPSHLEVLGTRFTDLGDTLQDVGGKISTYVTAPLVALGTYGVKSASDLTDGMAKVYTIATESQKPMAEMKQELIDLSDATGFGLDDLTQAAYQAVSASVDAADAVEFLGDATRLARAGFTTTEKSVDLLTTIMNAYGKETYEASYLSDLLLRTQNDGKTIVDELASSMGTVIPTAAAYNVGIEQVAAAYATMTKQGVNTARATTMLNALFTELERPNKDAAVLLVEETGKSFAQLMEDGASLGDVLGILYEHLDRDSEAFANLFVNVRSGRAANALMADDMSILTYELGRMEDATGQTDYALEMLETPSLKARRALNKLKNSTVDLGDTLISQAYPIFERMVEIVDDFRNWVKNLNDEQKHSIARWLELIAVVGPALKIGGVLLSTVGGAVDLFVKMKKATAGVTGAGKAMSAIINAEGLGFGALASSAGYALAAVAAVGVAFGVTALAAKNSNDEYRNAIVSANGLTESEKQLIESNSALHDSTMQMNTASKEEATVITDNAEKAKALAERYNWVMESTNLTTESKQKLAEMYLNQLADALGMELEDVQALVDENGKLSASIDEVIQKKRASALLSAYEDDYGEALKNRAQAEKEVIQLTTQLGIKEANLTQTQQDLEYWTKRANEEAKTGAGISKETQAALDQAVIAHGAANAAYEETAKQLGEANEAYQTIMNTIEGFEGTTAALATGSAYEIEASLIKLTEGFITAERGTKQSLENQVKNAKENLDKVQKAFEKGTEGITQETLDAYRKLYSDSQLELSKWTQLNGEQATKGMNEFNDNILAQRGNTKNATKQVMNEVNNEVAAGTRKATNTADTGMDGVPNAIRGKKNDTYNASKEVAGEAVRGFAGIEEDGKWIGKNFIKGFTEGMAMVNVTETAANVAAKAVGAARYKLQVYSPSRVMREVGQYFTEGFALGIGDETNLVQQASRSMAQSAVDSSWMLGNYSPTGLGYGSTTSNTRNITAPISVNVNVNGNVDDVDQLAEAVADRINDQIIRRNEVFA